MIRTLKGQVASIGNNQLVVEVNDIGYLVYTPTAKLSVIPQETIFLHTYLVVRENALDLYGFRSVDELDFFILLLSVPKIGPKSALQVLTQADVSLLYTSILEQDPDHLQKMSGLSKKTASNIVSALSGKVEAYSLSQGVPEANTLLTEAQIDAIDALITLGYEAKEARNYVGKLDKTSDTKSIVQAVLKQIPIP